MKYIFLIAISFFWGSLSAQVSDAFDDGDFTNNPTWIGDVADFTVAGNQLELSASVAGESYLVTPHNLTQLEDREWRFTLDYNLSPSSNNGGNTYLTAIASDLSTQPDGIFFHIGESGSNDAIHLIERSGGVETEILASTPGIVSSSFEMAIKIIYHVNGDWELFLDQSGSGIYQLNQTANYSTSVLGQYFGIDLTYTSSNINNFIYDNFYVGPIQVDAIAPNVIDVQAISANKITVLFDEAMDKTTTEVTTNFLVNQGIGQPISVLQSATNFALFTLTFANAFTVGETYQLTASSAQDLSGNPLLQQDESFLYVTSQTPDSRDIVINEFLADESPSIGLPETEYVELYNRSSKYFHLQNWQLRDNSSAGTIQDIWLYPGEYLLLIPSGSTSMFPSLINVVEVASWAGLNNAGDEIHLVTDLGFVVDEITYTDSWYKDTDKSDGGWSIERINPTLSCSSSSNWSASIATIGGTPGTQNSVYTNAPDVTAPQVLKTMAILPNQMWIYFSEKVDSLSLLSAQFTSIPTLTLSAVFTPSAFSDSVLLTFNESLVPGIVYHFYFSNFKDCSANIAQYEGSFVLPQTPEKGDLIINEILYNPPTGGVDFIEIYNYSDKYIDLKNWGLANWNDTISSLQKVKENYILFPHDYVTITTDSNFQKQHFPFAVAGKFIQLSGIPSYNNDSSTVYLIYNDTVMDHVSYSDDWQFELLHSTDGVSLERFSPEMPSNSASSWHSASQAVNFGTPGRVNSEDIKPGQEGGSLSLSSLTFSPDGDGFEDVVLITYKVTSANLLGNLTIYDDKGRMIKKLFSRRLLDTKETIKWDGIRENGLKASIGPYIILFETFNVDGGKESVTKKVVTLAGRL